MEQGSLATWLSGTSRAMAVATPATNLLVVGTPKRPSVMDGSTAVTRAPAIEVLEEGGSATSECLGDAFLSAQAAYAAAWVTV